ncbi:MAG: 8-oxo-dGTP diphosphatase [Candidatus Paceibacterota bacterium]
MKHATLCIPITDTHILLGKKKINFGIGKWNGFGGKIKEGESPEGATVRELMEECGLSAKEDDLEKVGILKFYFNNEPAFLVHTYLIRTWAGEPIESDEMTPQWHTRDTIPYDEMWKVDSLWMEKVFSGEKVSAHVYYKTSGIPGKDEETFDRIEYDESLWDAYV